MNAIPETSRVHEGRNLKRIREILQVKQSALATDLGGDWNQKKISQLEDKETIEPDLLDEIAHALKVPVEAIKNFDEQATVNIIANTFHDTQGLINYNPTFHNNQIDKFIQLHEEKMALYERMLKEKDEMMARLEKLLADK